MNIFNNYSGYNLGRSVVVLGKFDGVHKGHQLLLETAKKYKENCTIVAFTFKIKDNVKMLTDTVERRELLLKYGADAVIEQETNSGFLDMSAIEFIEKVLVEKLQAQVVVCGEDVGFGKARGGNLSLLMEASKKYGFMVDTVSKALYNDKVISSSLIRKELLTGNMETVNAMLGYRFSVSNTVVCGHKLGRRYSFPTANIFAHANKLLPPNGVYATRVYCNGESNFGVTNIGIRPSINNEHESVNIETFVIGIDENLYGSIMRLEFDRYFRKEKKFSNVDELFEQISRDAKNIKEYYNI